MDYSEFVIFYLKGKKYCLHLEAVKGLAIFDELVKHEQIETIIYDREISHEYINYVFGILNGKYNNTKYFKDIASIISVYDFMMFLTIDCQVINSVMCVLVKHIYFYDWFKYCADNNLCEKYYSIYTDYNECRYHSIEYNDSKWKEQFSKVEPDMLKKIILKFISKNCGWNANISKVCVGIKIDDKNEHKIIDRLWYWNESQTYFDKSYSVKNCIESLCCCYKDIFGEKVDVKLEVNNGLCSKLIVNGKNVEIINDTNMYDNKYVGFDLNKTFANHVTDIILGRVSL